MLKQTTPATRPAKEASSSSPQGGLKQLTGNFFLGRGSNAVKVIPKDKRIAKGAQA